MRKAIGWILVAPLLLMAGAVSVRFVLLVFEEPLTVGIVVVLFAMLIGGLHLLLPSLSPTPPMPKKPGKK